MASLETWILLRGLGQESGHWGAFTENFAEHVRPAPVRALDLPGAGEHRARVSPNHIGGMLEFVRAEALGAGTGGRFNLLALSLGGMVALEWMRLYPDELGRAVILNSSDGALSPPRDRLRWQTWGRFLKVLGQRNVREREKQLTDVLINDVGARARALPLWARLAAERPMGALSFAHQLWAAARFSNRGALPPVPTLVLSGLGDRMVDPSCSVQLASRHGWKHARHPWAGHDLTADDPDWVIHQIQPGTFPD